MKIASIILLFLFVIRTLQYYNIDRIDHPEGRLDRFTVTYTDSNHNPIVMEYEQEENIGGGDSGEVYRVYNKTYGRYEAFKKCEPDEDPLNEINIFYEISSHAGLAIYTIQLYFSLVVNVKTYLFMELGDYTLQNLLQDTAFVQRNYARIWNASLSLMHALHSHNISHNEAESRNLIIVKYYVGGKILHLLKAIDFNKSRSYESQYVQSLHDTKFSSDLMQLGSIMDHLVYYIPGVKDAIGEDKAKKIYKDCQHAYTDRYLKASTYDLLTEDAYRIVEHDIPREADDYPNLIRVELGQKPENKKSAKTPQPAGSSGQKKDKNSKVKGGGSRRKWF